MAIIGSFVNVIAGVSVLLGSKSFMDDKVGGADGPKIRDVIGVPLLGVGVLGILVSYVRNKSVRGEKKAENEEYLRKKEQVAGLDKEERYELYDENNLECDECGAVNKTVGYVEDGYKLCQPCDREMMANQGYEAETFDAESCPNCSSEMGRGGCYSCGYGMPANTWLQLFGAERISKPKEVILKEECGLCGDTLILVDDGLGQKYKTCLGESCGYILPMSAETFNADVDTEMKDFWNDNVKYSWQQWGFERYQNDRLNRSMKSCVKDWLADNPNELAYMVQDNHEINEESMDGDYEVPSPQMMKKEVAYLKSVLLKVADEMDKNGEWHEHSHKVNFDAETFVAERGLSYADIPDTTLAGTNNNPVRIIVGGPPHSGKSTLMNLIEDKMNQYGVAVELRDLDFSAPTDLKGGFDEKRDKKDWTPELARDAANYFKEDSENRVILGDSIGLISRINEIVSEPADVAILLVSGSQGDDEKTYRDAMRKWFTYYDDIDMPVLMVIRSSMNPEDKNYFDPHDNYGVIVGLDRNAYNQGGDSNEISLENACLEGIVFEIAQEFDLGLANRSARKHIDIVKQSWPKLKGKGTWNPIDAGKPHLAKVEDEYFEELKRRKSFVE